MSTQINIAAAIPAVAPSAVQAPAETSWGPGLAIAAALLLMVGCVAGVGAGWWYLGERRRVRRCHAHVPPSPRPEAPPATGVTLASQGVERPVARSRSPRHLAPVAGRNCHRLVSRSTSPQGSARRAA